MRFKILVGAVAIAALTATALAQPATPPPPGPRAAAPDAPPPPPPGGPRRDGPPPPPKGAHFHVGQGDSELDVKCADDEPMRACADIVMQLADKLITGQPIASRPSTPPLPPPPR